MNCHHGTHYFDPGEHVCRCGTVGLGEVGITWFSATARVVEQVACTYTDGQNAWLTAWKPEDCTDAA